MHDAVVVPPDQLLPLTSMLVGHALVILLFSCSVGIVAGSALAPCGPGAVPWHVREPFSVV